MLRTVFTNDFSAAPAVMLSLGYTEVRLAAVAAGG